MDNKAFFEKFENTYFFNGSSSRWAMSKFHWHSQYEVILFMSDNIEIYINDRKYKVNKGDLFLINNREHHKTVCKSENEYKRFVLMFEPDLFKEFEKRLDIKILRFFEERDDGFMHKINLSGTHLNEIIDIFNKIEFYYYYEESNYESTYLKIYILELLAKIDEKFSFLSYKYDEKSEELEFIDIGKLKIRNCQDRIEEIKNYIEENLDKKIDLDTLSETFYINKYYLSHFFKNETGFTVNKYVLNRKISKAKQLLKKGSTVIDVAEYLGYCNYTYFINVFKRETGTTPKQYSIKKISEERRKENNGD